MKNEGVRMKNGLRYPGVILSVLYGQFFILHY